MSGQRAFNVPTMSFTEFKRILESLAPHETFCQFCGEIIPRARLFRHASNCIATKAACREVTK